MNSASRLPSTGRHVISRSELEYDASWSMPSVPIPIGPAQATAIFRIYQEILTNVVRHVLSFHYPHALEHLSRLAGF